jgi:hypothetical protein
VLEELIRNQTENASVNKALAKASLRLEQVVAASFLIYAKDFFQTSKHISLIGFGLGVRLQMEFYRESR